MEPMSYWYWLVTSLWLSFISLFAAFKRFFISEPIPTKYTNHIVFVSGLASYSQQELLAVPYWGIFNDTRIPVPKIGPFSSFYDRACELGYTLLGSGIIRYYHGSLGISGNPEKDPHLPSKPNTFLSPLRGSLYHLLERFLGHKQISYKDLHWDNESKLDFICHSAGGPTMNALLDLLEIHFAEIVRQSNIISHFDSTIQLKWHDYHYTLSKDVMQHLMENKHHHYIFFKNEKEPYFIGPQAVNKIIYVSSPVGGFESVACIGGDATHIRFGSFSWFAGVLVCLYDFLPFNLLRYIYDIFLKQFSLLYWFKFINTGDTILQDFDMIRCRQFHDKALQIIQRYNIQTRNVITLASIKVGSPWSNKYVWHLLQPGNNLIITFIGMLLGQGYTTDFRYHDCNPYPKESSVNDGIASVRSQVYGTTCSLCSKIAYNTENVNEFIPNVTFQNPIYKCPECTNIYVYGNHADMCGTFSSYSYIKNIYQEFLAWTNK